MLQFSTVIRSVQRCTTLAKQCAAEFVRHSQNEHAPSAEFCVTFVNECFKLINSDCHISVQQLQLGPESYSWSASRWDYRFDYQPNKQQRFENFLQQFCQEMLQLHKKQEQQLLTTAEAESAVDDNTMPLKCLLHLLSTWLSIYEDIFCLNVVGEDEDGDEDRQEAFKNFKEPMTRINLSLLLGIENIRKEYSIVAPLWQDVHKSLLTSAMLGVHYKRFYADTSKALIKLFESDWDHFIAEAILCYTNMFKHKPEDMAFVPIMLHLKTRLEQVDASSVANKHRLINFLIDSNTTLIFFNWLDSKIKRNTIAFLQMLEVLQRTVISVEIFPPTFMKAILMKCINEDKQVMNLAAQVYFKIMGRLLQQSLIVKTTLEFGYKYCEDTKCVKGFALCVWQNSQLMQSPKLIFLQIVKAGSSAPQFQCYLTKFFLSVFEEMLKDIEKYANEILWTLKKVPKALKQLSVNDPLAPCLLSTLFAVNFNNLVNALERTNLSDYCSRVLQYLEQELFHLFFNERLEETRYFINIFVVLTNCLMVTKNWRKLQNQLVETFDKFKIIDKIRHTRADVHEQHCIVLQKMSIIIASDFGITYNYLSLVEFVELRLFSTNLLLDASIEMFCTRLLAYSLVHHKAKLARSNCNIGNEQMLELANKLSKYLFEQLMQSVSQSPSLRFYYAFDSLMALYYYKFSVGELKVLPLDSETYHKITDILARTLKSVAVDVAEEEDTDVAHQYKVFMLESYVRLHKTKSVKPPNNSAWKVAIYYTKSKKIYDAQIRQLLEALIENHYAVYRKCMHTLLFNLPHHDSSIRRNNLVQALKAHLEIMKASRHVANLNALKVDIVFNVCEMLSGHLKVTNIIANKNRVRILDDIFIMIEGLKVPQIVLDKFMQLVAELKINNLNRLERQSLKTYESKVKSLPISVRQVTANLGNDAQLQAAVEQENIESAENANN